MNYCCSTMERFMKVVNRGGLAQYNFKTMEIQFVGTYDSEEWDHEFPFKIICCQFCGEQL